MNDLLTGRLLAIGIPIGALLLLIVCYKLVLRIFGVIIIPKNTIGIVNKKFVLFGTNKTLPDGEIIALKGEAGIQADTLPPGIPGHGNTASRFRNLLPYAQAKSAWSKQRAASH